MAACTADSASRLAEPEVEVIGDTGGRGDPTPQDTGGTGLPSDDASESDTGDSGPETGLFLDPCESDDDCFAGFCVPFEGERVCTQYCGGGECPDGWDCRTLTTSGTDAVRICVPDRETLCSPCETDIDCGGFGDRCVRVGTGAFCARDCEATRECPDGYLCDPAFSVDGTNTLQCVPASGRCSCPPELYGTSRPCVRGNDIGICEGVEVCEPDLGWSRCTAPVPSEEICDGIDNNCNNRVDEGLEPRPCMSTPNAIGTCEGTETCRGAQGWICDAPAASVEICDGLDNDCNGTIDDGLCFDGNPCTTDVCDPETGGCSYLPFAGPCDDGNVCTINTMCGADGSCSGSPRNCDDGNPCTRDSCDPVAGCVHDPIDGAACETGNLCTVDVCRSGVCTPGPTRDCGSADTCMAPSCDPGTGCTTTRLTGNPCNDGDACTVGDMCSNGACIGGGSACAGRPCSNCSGTWGIGGICLELFGSPVCNCLCL